MRGCSSATVRLRTPIRREVVNNNWLKWHRQGGARSPSKWSPAARRRPFYRYAAPMRSENAEAAEFSAHTLPLPTAIGTDHLAPAGSIGWTRRDSRSNHDASGDAAGNGGGTPSPSAAAPTPSPPASPPDLINLCGRDRPLQRRPDNRKRGCGGERGRNH
jgi:hypothetical protein